jgi:D-alanyl-lipoteichoic acid acyltransferase DltB (MBOAT superfamily)
LPAGQRPDNFAGQQAGMVFNSLTFLIFLAIVLVAYYRLPFRGQNLMLLGASYIFYGWWDWRFVFLLLFTSYFDYWCAQWIDGEHDRRKRKLFLSFSMVVNLGVLGVFKYFNFFADSLQHVLATLGMKADFPVLHIILPVGISFYTFLSMSYTIDVYRGEMKPTRNPLDFLRYVSFFPHLVAGPIVRASFLLPQCAAPRVVKPNEVVNGIWQILMGYVKKVVIADRLAEVVSHGFAQAGPPVADANSWLFIYAFALQIYGDFSGYSDIARGLAKLMGFELVTNFRAPYLVTNPSSFWQHWHISLSTWLRDYLYIPLGGNRKGRRRTYINLMTTMLLGGLWHGAGVAYILWGAYHGALLAVHHAWRDLTGAGHKVLPKAPPKAGPHWAWRFLLVVVFFHLTCLGWLLFRAGSSHFNQVQVVTNYLHAMFTLPVAGINPLFLPVIVLGGLTFFFQWQYDRMDHFSTWQPRWQAAGVASALALIAGLGVFDQMQFIYFQF